MKNTITNKFECKKISNHQFSMHKKNLDVEKGFSYFDSSNDIIHIETPVDSTSFKVIDIFYHNFNIIDILVIQIYKNGERVRNNEKEHILTGTFNSMDINPKYDVLNLKTIEHLHVIIYNDNGEYEFPPKSFVPQEAGGGVIVTGP